LILKHPEFKADSRSEENVRKNVGEKFQPEKLFYFKHSRSSEKWFFLKHSKSTEKLFPKTFQVPRKMFF
jgi:hypothetical protein